MGIVDPKFCVFDDHMVDRLLDSVLRKREVSSQYVKSPIRRTNGALYYVI